MKVLPTPIAGVLVVEPRVFGDHRGFFLESWNRQAMQDAGIPADFVQDNHSRSVRGTLRGMHFQLQHPQGKLVRVARGAVYDVVVDVRRGSPTFGHWFGTELSDTNYRMLWAPPGMAHGFLAISDTVDFVYKCTDYYHPEHERVLQWSDPDVAIEWPTPAGKAPKLSARDALGASLSTLECFP